MRSRQAVVDLVKSWEGKKESNGTHKSIIDIYNGYNAACRQYRAVERKNQRTGRHIYGHSAFAVEIKTSSCINLLNIDN